MSDNARIRTRLIAKLAATVLVAGALLAGLLFPWVGGGGLAVRNSASLIDALPVSLTDRMPSGNSKVLAADGTLLTNFYANNRTLVKSDQIAAVMKQALVDIEDSRFYEHNGLDVQGTMRALVKNVAAGSVQEGGSTLTQQLVKQTLLQTAQTPEERQAAKEQTVGRKLREARLALALEEKYSKDEILTRYLNMVYFGQGAYGIEAAAQRYFSVHAEDLTLPQAAMLAGLVQSPTNDDPITHPDNAMNRRDQVLERMHQLGHISDEELAEVKGQPVAVQPGAAAPNGCINASVGGFFCAYLYDYLTQKLGLGRDQIENGGLTIQTTLRPDVQRSGDQAVLNTVPMGDPVVGTFTAVEPGTGHVMAMSSNRQFGCSNGPQCESVNFNVVPSKGAGSTYKVFTATAALEQGFGAHYTITTPQPYVSKIYKKNGGTRGAPYVISNVGSHYPDTLDLSKALVMSSNTYFVALEDALGSIEPPVRAAEAMGMHFDAPNQKPAQQWIDGRSAAFTLGPEATSPLDLASAYSTLAGRGTRCEPTPVTKILDATGKPLTDAKGKPVDTGDHCTPNAVPQGVADTMNQIMVGDTTQSYGTATRAAIPGHDIAGKTGTVQNNDSVVFVGSTPQFTASVMVFRPKGTDSVGGFGGNKPATIWHDAMLPILSPLPNSPWPPADPAVVAGTRQQPDNTSASSGTRTPRAPRTATPSPAPEQPTPNQGTGDQGTGATPGDQPGGAPHAGVGTAGGVPADRFPGGGRRRGDGEGGH